MPWIRLLSVTVLASALLWSSPAVADNDEQCFGNDPRMQQWPRSTGIQLVDEQRQTGVRYVEIYSGCAPGGGYICDNRTCCECHRMHFVALEADALESLEHPLFLRGEELRCSRTLPEVTVDTEQNRIEVADLHDCQVLMPGVDDADYPVTPDSDERLEARSPSIEEFDVPNYFERNETARGWLYERTRPFIQYIGRIGMACSVEVARTIVDQLHARLEDVDANQGDADDLLALLHTDMLTHACGLTHPAWTACESFFADGGHLNHLCDEDDDTRQRIVEQLLELGEFAAEHGYGWAARRWVLGALAHEIDYAPEDRDGFSPLHDGPWLTSDQAIEYLDAERLNHLGQAFEDARLHLKTDRPRPPFGHGERPIQDVSHHGDVYDQRVEDYLEAGETIRAFGAYRMSQLAGQRPPDRQRALDEAIFEHLHDRIVDADRRADRESVAAYLWLFDDWLLDDPTAVRDPAPGHRVWASVDDEFSNFPYISVAEPEESKADDRLYLTDHRVLEATDEHLDALVDLAEIGHRMGRQRWFWPRYAGTLASIGGDPNPMPVIQSWVNEVLRHDSGHPDALELAGDWYWHRAQWTRGFTLGPLRERLDEREDEIDAIDDCDEQIEVVERISRSATEEALEDSARQREGYRDAARDYWRRLARSLPDGSNDLPRHLQSRLDAHPESACELKAFILSAPESTTDETDAQFEFACNDLDCDFECSLNDHPFEQCDSTVEYETLAPGHHELNIRAVDRTGQQVSAPAQFRWTIESDNSPGR